MAENSPRTGLDPGLYPELYANPGTGEPEEPLPFRAFTRRRMLGALLVVVVLTVLVVVPPLFNVGRYKREIASSIGASLGRPVHIDHVTLNLLPLPGFTLERFVVGEDPAFGAEPVLRADEVRATIRFGSLWRRRLEFSRIALTDPSINLVHLPDGRWNLESILLQASKIAAAPTDRKTSGDTPRFPYIEASGARINLKIGLEKTPFSLTDADAALWLPEPGQWHLRLKAHPTRTDTAVSDTGLLRAEGTLGQAATLAAVPLDLRADWTDAPLGALSWIVMGRDAGMRGTMNLHGAIAGTLNQNRVTADLNLENVRRADFVPQRSLSAVVHCGVQTGNFFQSIEQGHCVWPGEADGSGMLVDFKIPEIAHLASTRGTLTLHAVPLSGVLDALRVASPRVSPDLVASGSISGSFPCCAPVPAEAGTPRMPSSTVSPVTTPALTIQNAIVQLHDQPAYVQGSLSASLAWPSSAEPSLTFLPIPLYLGARLPAQLAVNISRGGFALQLTGDALPSALIQLNHALPQFGDGLLPAIPLLETVPSDPAADANAPIHLNLTGEHGWTTGQTWTAVRTPSATSHRADRHRH